MAKNYMAEVAKMLGVELGEEFKINECGNEPYKLTEKGLETFVANGWRGQGEFMFMWLIKGEHEIIKLPWKPKKGENYYYVSWCKENGKWIISAAEAEYWPIYDGDALRVDIGNCFQTIEEAEAQKYEVFKRLTGKEWSEVHGGEVSKNE